MAESMKSMHSGMHGASLRSFPTGASLKNFPVGDAGEKMGSQQFLIDPEEKRKKGNREKWDLLRDYMYHTEANGRVVVLGRDVFSWRSYILYYGVFYLCLLTLFTTLLGVFTLILDEITPMHYGRGSPMQGEPGMSMRPLADFESPLIRFIQGKPSTYKPHTDHIMTFLDQYELTKQEGENFIDCALGRPPNMEHKVCIFDVNTLGGACTWQRDYGFDEGKPCLLFKINKMHDFRPEMYESLAEIPDADARELIGDNFDPEYVPITCHGRYDADIENIGNVTFYPPQGLSKHFYPYLNQEGYRAPIIMAQLEAPINGVVVNIICKAWAKNIRQNENDRIGVITFELLVD